MFPIAEDAPKLTDDIAKRLAERIYKGEKIVSDRELLRATAAELMHGVKKGYGKADWNAADTETIEHLTENVYQFAAAKNWHELRDMTDAVHDGNRIRTFEEFAEKVDGISGKYNRDWLRTEYNQAVAASQSAARWDGFKRRQEEMPYLQYQCIMDGNTRPEHAALHGVIKRMDDPFWTQYMPPNGWGCRCEAVQMPGSRYRETPDSKIQLPNVPQMFRINFGQNALAFPPGHAYFKRMPDNVWKKLKGEIRIEVLHYEQKETRRFVNKNVEKVSIDSKQYYTTHLVCGHRDMKNVISHCMTMDELHVAKNLNKYLPNLKDGKYEPLKPKGNTAKKIAERHVRNYTVYDFEADGDKYILKCEAIKREKDAHVEEHPYFLKKKK